MPKTGSVGTDTFYLLATPEAMEHWSLPAEAIIGYTIGHEIGCVLIDVNLSY